MTWPLIVDFVTDSEAPGETVTAPLCLAFTRQVRPLLTVSCLEFVPVIVVVQAIGVIQVIVTDGV